MVVYENQCVDCIGVGLYCLGSSCKNRHVPIVYCDICGRVMTDEVSTIDEDDEHICHRCQEEEEENEDD